MSQQLSTHSTPSTYTEGKKRGGIQSEAVLEGGTMCLASTHRAAKWQGCGALTCAVAAAPFKMPGPLAEELKMTF